MKAFIRFLSVLMLFGLSLFVESCRPAPEPDVLPTSDEAKADVAVKWANMTGRTIYRGLLWADKLGIISTSWGGASRLNWNTDDADDASLHGFFFIRY